MATQVKAKTFRRAHLYLTVLWFLLVIPTMLWWRESVMWVALISCYANAVGHFSAWQATRAEEANGNGTEGKDAQ